jgi:hypothetical protein
MHEKNRMMDLAEQTRLMPVSYEHALLQAVFTLEEIVQNLRSWPASCTSIQVPANFTHKPRGNTTVRHTAPPPADNDLLLPLACEINRAYDALDSILNAFHFTHGGVYSLDYHPRMPEMAGHDSDPWVAAYTMQQPMDKSAFRAAFHAILTTIELLKSSDLHVFSENIEAIAHLYQSTLDHLTVRQQLYAKEHPSAAAPSETVEDYAYPKGKRNRKVRVAA